MSVDAQVGRAFELSLRQSCDDVVQARPQLPNESFYVELMRVSFRHTYYNLMDKACPDFAVLPSSYSRTLMQSLGLLFKDEGTGFSILYNRARAESLISYLRRQGTLDGTGLYWTRLSFALCQRNPYFINITDIPIDLIPTNRNFYFSNRSAHVETDGGIVLNTGERVDAAQLLPVIPPQYTIPLPESVAGPMPNTVVGVEVRSISGEVVICEPRCMPDPPVQWPLSGSTPRCSEWLLGLEPPPATSQRCRDAVHLNFSRLREDKYDIAYLTEAGEFVPFGTCLYTIEAPTPLCFIDLLFSDPTGQENCAYPVSLPGDSGGTIECIDYVLDFEARSTWWHYYVVPRSQIDDFDDLAIEVLDPGFPPETPDRRVPLRFIGPAQVTLPNGKWGYLFVSNQPLRLQQQSDYRFRLRGQRFSDPFDRVLVDRMPVASQQQVQPLPDPIVGLRFANSLRAGAERTEGGRALIRHFFGTDGISDEGSLERMQQLRRAAKASARSAALPRRGARLPTTTVSDIYVYV